LKTTHHPGGMLERPLLLNHIRHERISSYKNLTISVRI
jgi:hypothetical protein